MFSYCALASADAAAAWDNQLSTLRQELECEGHTAALLAAFDSAFEDTERVEPDLVRPDLESLRRMLDEGRDGWET